jgi:hypothetical protein
MLRGVAICTVVLATACLPQSGKAQAQSGSYYPQAGYAAPAQPGYNAQNQSGYAVPGQPAYRAASAPATQAGYGTPTQYDGVYAGVIQLANGGSGCSQGARRRMEIRNGTVTFVANTQLGTTLTGAVRPDGTFAVTGTQNGGQVNATGRIQGTSLNGQVVTTNCSYTIAMQKARQ